MKKHPIEPGFYDGMPFEDYLAIPALSASGMRLLDRSRAHFISAPRDPTRAMNIGTAAHCKILTPEGYVNSYTCPPKGLSLTSKKGKALLAEAKANGDIVINARVGAAVDGLALAIQNHPIAGPLLARESHKHAVPERSWFWQDPVYGFLCKARTDFFRFERDFVLDLKTTTDARDFAFRRRIEDKKYHWAAAHYLDGVSIVLKRNVTNYVWIVVEVEPPHGVAVYVPDAEMLQIARSQMRDTFREYHQGLKTGLWPCYPPLASVISLSRWQKAQERSVIYD